MKVVRQPSDIPEGHHYQLVVIEKGEEATNGQVFVCTERRELDQKVAELLRENPFRHDWAASEVIGQVTKPVDVHHA